MAGVAMCDRYVDDDDGSAGGCRCCRYGGWVLWQ